MKHRRKRKRFRHAPRPSHLRAPAASAAVLAVATVSGILLTQWHGGDARAGSPNVDFAGIAVGGGAGAAPGSVLPAPHGSGSLLGSSASTALRSRTSAASAAAARAKPPALVAGAVPSGPAAAAGPVKQPTGAAAAPPAAPMPPPLPTAASSKVLTFQYQAQINGYYCGPAATRIALTARGKFPTQDAVAASLGTTTSGTNSAADITRALNSLLGETTYQTHLIQGAGPSAAETAQFQADVVRAIGSGYAVVANIVGTAVDVAGAAHSYGNGHFLTVVGYRDDGLTVKVADPASPGGDGTYWMTTTTFANWMGHRGYAA